MPIFLSIVFTLVMIGFMGKATDVKLSFNERTTYIYATVAMAGMLIIVNLIL